MLGLNSGRKRSSTFGGSFGDQYKHHLGDLGHHKNAMIRELAKKIKLDLT